DGCRKNEGLSGLWESLTYIFYIFQKTLNQLSIRFVENQYLHQIQPNIALTSQIEHPHWSSYQHINFILQSDIQRDLFYATINGESRYPGASADFLKHFCHL